ncbi:MAG: hypothetical protein U0800_20605 [Isosphaeraceae bacterium]
MRRSAGPMGVDLTTIIACLAMAAAVLNILCNPFSPLEYLRLAARPPADAGPGPDSPSGIEAVADLDEVMALPSGARPSKAKAAPLESPSSTLPEPAGLFLHSPDPCPPADLTRTQWRYCRFRC